MDKIVLTDNAKAVLNFMQGHDEVLVGKDMIDMTGIKGIYPVLNSLIKNQLVEQDDPVVRPFTNNKGETKPKEYKTYKLTEFGRNYQLD